MDMQTWYDKNREDLINEFLSEHYYWFLEWIEDLTESDFSGFRSPLEMKSAFINNHMVHKKKSVQSVWLEFLDSEFNAVRS